MRTPLKITFFLLALGISGSAYTDSPVQSTLPLAAPEHQEEPQEFSGSVIHVDHKLSYFQVSLPENPSTGFRCYLSKYDGQLVEPLSSTYVPNGAAVNADSSENAMAGAGGIRTFVFQIKPVFHNAPQKTKIEFRYDRPWASGEKSSKKVITVYSS